MCHTARETLQLLHKKYPESVISCDSTPLDYFLWGYEKRQVYRDSFRTFETLKLIVIRVTGEIKPQKLINFVKESGTSELSFIEKKWQTLNLKNMYTVVPMH